jgi:hypothetical protein
MPLVQPASTTTAAGFKAAAKAIQSAEDLKAFLGSDTAKDFVGFILALNAAVGGECTQCSCGGGEAVCWGVWRMGKGGFILALNAAVGGEFESSVGVFGC